MSNNKVLELEKIGTQLKICIKETKFDLLLIEHVLMQ